jgi:hypothetical protein
MSILTGRELEFLASLRTNWKRLYWNELARLLSGDDGPCDVGQEALRIAPAIRTLEKLHCERGGQILAFVSKAQMRQRPDTERDRAVSPAKKRE